MACTDLSPNTLLTQNMDFHAHQSPGIITMCVYAHICRRVYLHCAFAAFEVTQCCVSPSGAFGRLSERWMTAVISTSAPCRLLPLSFLSAPCSISPFLYPSTSPPLLFVSSLPFPPPSSCNFFSFSISAFIESHTISLYSLWALPLERAETVQCCRIICYHGLGFI